MVKIVGRKGAFVFTAFLCKLKAIELSVRADEYALFTSVSVHAGESLGRSEST